MRNYIFILLLITVYSCKAQNIIVPLGSGEPVIHNPDYYIKDIGNVYNKFEGIWKFTNGNTEITLMLKKEVRYQISSNDLYEDLLVGEYQFLENGVEVVNTLWDFDHPNVTGYDHSIGGGVFIHELPDHCIDNSDISEIKIFLRMDHPLYENVEGNLIIRYVNDNGLEKLEACIYDNTTIGDPNVRIDIPNGYYVFVKQ